MSAIENSLNQVCHTLLWIIILGEGKGRQKTTFPFPRVLCFGCDTGSSSDSLFLVTNSSQLSGLHVSFSICPSTPPYISIHSSPRSLFQLLCLCKSPLLFISALKAIPCKFASPVLVSSSCRPHSLHRLPDF